MSFNASNLTIPYYLMYVIGMIIFVPAPTPMAKVGFWVGLVVVSLFLYGLYVPSMMSSGDMGCSLHLSMIAGIVVLVICRRTGVDPVWTAASPWAVCVPLPLVALVIKVLANTGTWVERRRKLTKVDDPHSPEFRALLCDGSRDIRKRARETYFSTKPAPEDLVKAALEAARTGSVSGEESHAWLEALKGTGPLYRPALIKLWGDDLRYSLADEEIEELLLAMPDAFTDHAIRDAARRRIKASSNIDRFISGLVKVDVDAAVALASQGLESVAVTREALVVFPHDAAARAVAGAIDLALAGKKDKDAASLLPHVHFLPPAAAVQLLIRALDWPVDERRLADCLRRALLTELSPRLKEVPEETKKFTDRVREKLAASEKYQADWQHVLDILQKPGAADE